MLKSRLFILFFTVFSLISFNSQAGLPFFDSQGEQLPTLAPMLEKVTPAVVNISTRGYVRAQENPFLVVGQRTVQGRPGQGGMRVCQVTALM